MACAFNLGLDQNYLVPLSCGGALDAPSACSGVRRRRFTRKIRVYSNLLEKRMVVKTGFKFGSHFRVYKQVHGPEKVPHSDYLVHTLPQFTSFCPPVHSRAVRLAHLVRKSMIFAYPLEGEGRLVSYLEIKRLKP